MNARLRSVACMGGGPAGLYLALLLKRNDPSRHVVVYERNRADDTFGFGVIFSDQTLATFDEADHESGKTIRQASVHWDDLDVWVGPTRITSSGHGFAGLGRKHMLHLLQARAAALGVELRFREEAQLDPLLAEYDLVVAADGVNSASRERHAETFQPSIDLRPNRFIWLGSTQPLTSFTFYFDRNEHGLFRVHAYRYDATASTFIVECTDETFARTGLDPTDEAGALRYCEQLFAHRLEGHKLLSSHSTWRRFPTVRNRRWHEGKLVLVGDAAHTAHFSIGSGTKLAIEDSIALAAAIEREGTLEEALAAYDRDRQPQVARLQRAAETSLRWFERTEQYFDRLDPLTFTYSLLTRSLRLDHDNLRLRDPKLVERVDAAFGGRDRPSGSSTSPMFAPLVLRGLSIPNRVGLAPMVQDAAKDGVVGDWHLVHYGARAVGGAGLLLTEMTAVRQDGRLSLGGAGLWNDAQVAAWKRVCDFVHEQGLAKIGVQLGHAGRRAYAPSPTAASPIPWAERPTPVELDRDGMDRVREAFVAATHRARAAGFDLVELQLGHGHLLADFFSPLTNHRKDAYGGTIAQRLAFPVEVAAAVRAAWPADRPLAARISASDWQAGGLTIEDAVEIARALAVLGCDIIDVSSGETTPASAPPYGRLYQIALAEHVRLVAGVPTMASGGITTAGDLNAVLAGGRADLCLVGHEHLWDPYFTHHAEANEGREPAWPGPYDVLRRYRPRR